MRFESIRHSCTCQQSDIDAMTLEPGATTVLHMTADLRHRTGKQRFLSYLKEVGGGEWVCELETVVFARTYFEPTAPLMFGMVGPGQRIEKVVTLCVFGRTEADLPTRVEFDLAGGQVTIAERKPAVTERAADCIFVRRFPLRVLLVTPNDAGPSEVTLNAHFVLNNERVEARSSGGWQLRPQLTLSPPQAFWSQPPKAGSADTTRSILIRRGDGQELTIDRVEGADEAVECVIEVPQKPAPLQVVRVRVDSSRLKTPLWRELTVHVGKGTSESIKLLVVVADANDTNSDVKVLPK